MYVEDHVNCIHLTHKNIGENTDTGQLGNGFKKDNPGINGTSIHYTPTGTLCFSEAAMSFSRFI